MDRTSARDKLLRFCEKSNLNPEVFLLDLQSLPDGEFDKKYPGAKALFFKILDALKTSFSGSLDNIENNGRFEVESCAGVSFNSPVIQHEYVIEILECLGLAPAVRGCCGWVIPSRHSVGIIKRTVPGGAESYRWNSAHLARCHNVWLCPLCRSYILRGRCREVTTAYDRWIGEGGNVYMLTLTAAHNRDTRLETMLPAMKQSYHDLRHSPPWVALWPSCGSPTGTACVISNWEFTFGRGGIHPHRHILLFTRSDASHYGDRLKRAWVEACAKNGLTASVHAQDFQRITSRPEYVSKMGWEMCDSAFAKEGRGDGRMSYIELCSRGVMGEAWAIGQLRDYVGSVKYLRALHWSKGLKSRFKVENIDDDKIIEVETAILARHAYVGRESYMHLGRVNRQALLCGLDASQGQITDDMRVYLQHCSVYGLNGETLLNAKSESEQEIHLIRAEIRADLLLYQKAVSALPLEGAGGGDPDDGGGVPAPTSGFDSSFDNPEIY